MVNCFAVCSGKGGTGKSTVATALSYCFSDRGKSVAVIDLDRELRCLDVMFGIDDRIILDLSDALSGRELSDAVYQVPNTKISLIPASSDGKPVDFTLLADLVKRLCDDYDIVIADLPAGINRELFDTLSAVNSQFLVVSNTDRISLRDASFTAKALNCSKISPKLIINKFDTDFIKSGYCGNIDDMIDTAQLQLIGIVPDSNDLNVLKLSRRPKKNSRSYKAVDRITSRLCGENIKLPNPKKI